MTHDTTDATANRVTGPESRSTRLQAWGLTGVLVFLYMINYADKSLLGLVAQPLSEEYGLTAAQIGLASGAFYLAFTLGGFGAGGLNRWAGLRWGLALLALVWALTMLPMVIAGGFAVLLVCRFLLGLAEGPSSALIHTAAYSWHPPEKRNIPGAWITAGGSFGKIAISPVLASVIFIWGWRAAFVVTAVIGIVWCLVWLLVWKNGPYAQSTADRAITDSQIDTTAASVPLRSIFLTPTFLGGLAAVFSFYSLTTVVMTWLPSYFELGLGYSRLQAGTMFGVPSITGVIGVFVIGLLSNRLLRRFGARWARGILPATALVLCGLCLLVLPLVPGALASVVVVSIGYGFGLSVFPLFNAAVSQICPPERLASALGVFLALMAVGGLVAPYITGAIVDAATSPAAGYAAAFQLFGGLVLVGGLIAMVTVSPDRDAEKLRMVVAG